MPTRRQRPVPPALEIVLPATSANLGPAFDCAALALKLHLTIQAQLAPEFSVEACGRDTEICGALGGNLMLRTYHKVLEAKGRPVQPLALEVANQIPIGKGLGSSAAARLAGIILANHFGGLGWSDQRILEEAARREGHADNVVACWRGGVGLASFSGNQLCALGLRAPAWPLLLAVAPQRVLTRQARAVLPLDVPHVDAVANLQATTLLMAAFTQRRPDLLRDALCDRLHEPYRASMCPLLEPLRALAKSDGILGAVLSGAGPSVLMVLAPGASPGRIRHAVSEYLQQNNLDAELLLTSVEPRGASQRCRTLAGSKTRTA